MAKKHKKSYPIIRLNRKAQEKHPVPPEIYEYVQNNMWHLSLDELKSELEVSKWIAKALRNGVQINLSYDRLMILKSNIASIHRFCLRSRIGCVIEDSRYRGLYIKLNHYLAKVIAEIPQDIAKITRGGWTTRHVNFLRAVSPWREQLVTIQLLAELKEWYAMVHERYPEFDPILFEGTGLFDNKSANEEKNVSNEQGANPIQKEKRKRRSSCKSPYSTKNLASLLINTGLFSTPSRVRKDI